MRATGTCPYHQPYINLQGEYKFSD